MNETPLPDPLEAFLQTPPSLPTNASLQHALLQRTIGTMAPRRRWRNWAYVGALAACLGATFVAGWFMGRIWQTDAPGHPEVVEVKPTPPVEPPAPLPKQPAPAPKFLPTNPRELEWLAFDAMEERVRAQLYFRAGDLYLDRLNDIDSALRCYQQAFATCSTDEFAPSADDNWFLASLKRERPTEK